jgi:AhpD family alkylhydroperoxidase
MADTKTWQEKIDHRMSLMQRFGQANPEVMKAFRGLMGPGMAANAIDEKTKELVAVGIAVAIRCDDCIALHVKNAVGVGVTRQELIDVVSVCMVMGGGPSMMYGTHALEVIDELAPQA